MGETALLLWTAWSAGRRFADVRAGVEEVAEELEPIARREQVRVALCLHPPAARDFGLAHVCLSAIGHPDEGFDRLFRHSARAPSANGRERLPHREMEQRWVDRVWSGDFEPRRVDRQLVRSSNLGRPPRALDATRDDIYAFTHGLMFATDMGASPAAVGLGRASIKAAAEAALARCLDTEDYDLGGEVLLAWPMLGARWSSAASFGFRTLARVEDEVGFLPAPITRVERYRTIPDAGARTRYLLATTYHTAYVMGLLCATALRPGASSPARRWADRPRAGAAACASLRELLDDGGARPHWLGALDALEPGQRGALAELMLVIALQRAARAQDLRRLRDALRLGVDLGLAGGPATREAAALLTAAAHLGGAPASARPAAVPGA